jgi:ankyrin repeat protein
VKSKNGVTCLHLACAAGNLETVKFLLSEYSNLFHVGLKTKASDSLPIHVVAKGGQLEVLKYLVSEMKADPTLPDKNHEDCLTIAIKSKHFAISEYLIGLKKFDLNKLNQRSGFNYFSYSLVKGQTKVA